MASRTFQQLRDAVERTASLSRDEMPDSPARVYTLEATSQFGNFREMIMGTLNSTSGSGKRIYDEKLRLNRPPIYDDILRAINKSPQIKEKNDTQEGFFEEPSLDIYGNPIVPAPDEY